MSAETDALVWARAREVAGWWHEHRCPCGERSEGQRFVRYGTSNGRGWLMAVCLSCSHTIARNINGSVVTVGVYDKMVFEYRVD